jgi:hypothetical protein
MLAKALEISYELPVEVTSIADYDLIPTYRNKRQRFRFNDRIDMPRIQHSHAHYSVLFRGRRVILMVRDLRDTLVSHYRTYVEMTGQRVSFSDFLRGRNVQRPGQRNNDTLRTLIEFLNSWCRGLRQVQESHVVRFEDLRRDTEGELIRVLGFVPFPEAAVQRVGEIVKCGSLDNMRALEERNPLPQYRGRVRKVREGAVGKGRDYFAVGDREYFVQIVSQELLYDFGYRYEELSWGAR